MENPANRLADFPADQFTIWAFCDACSHSAMLDRRRIPARVTVQGLGARLRCSACGHRGGSIRIVYTAAGEFRYGYQKDPCSP